MLTFKQFQTTTLSEASAFRIPTGEKEIKKFKAGKGKVKYDAVIAQKGRLFALYIDGEQLDVFNSSKAAEKAANEFVELMGANA
jgi:nucleoid-associated protein YgaU